MKRKIIVLAASLILVTAMQCFASIYTRGVAGNVSAVLEEMNRAVLQEDWLQARSLMEPLSRSWYGACEPMDWWISRSIIDEVHSSMRELAIALDVGDYHESRVLLDELQDLINDITRRDELTLSNVV
ncbi:MAG: DUF4363 family protein [Oscillospiraceae bacterium]|jgi:hypothetical protein|nr:DUF4363 family protein [Oscillospiraceae bacterium]